MEEKRKLAISKPTSIFNFSSSEETGWKGWGSAAKEGAETTPSATEGLYRT